MKTSESVQVDVVIVGGGIIGLFCAYEILLTKPHSSVVVLEKESFLGEHTSGRNSEVLHSGLYYETNSLKHLHCLEGNNLWRELVKKFQLPFLDSGKVIVANATQKEELEGLHQKALANGVKGITRISLSHPMWQPISKCVIGVDGLFLPTSGVLNASASIQFLRQKIEAMGGMIMLSHLAQSIERHPQGFSTKTLSTIDQKVTFITSEVFINCAGLMAPSLRETLIPLKSPCVTSYFVKGRYLTLKNQKSPSWSEVKTLIYPIPPKDGLGLGVHLTLDTGGQMKFGPDTLETSEIKYFLEESLVDEMFPKILTTFRNIERNDLQLGYSGIRPKIKVDGVLHKDFWLKNFDGYVELLGIESPGLTAAPSLARRITELL